VSEIKGKTDEEWEESFRSEEMALKLMETGGWFGKRLEG